MHLLLLAFLVAFQILPRLLEMGCLGMPGLSWIGAVRYMIALSISPARKILEPNKKNFAWSQEEILWRASDHCWLCITCSPHSYSETCVIECFILCTGAAHSLACYTRIILGKIPENKYPEVGIQLCRIILKLLHGIFILMAKASMVVWLSTTYLRIYVWYSFDSPLFICSVMSLDWAMQSFFFFFFLFSPLPYNTVKP